MAPYLFGLRAIGVAAGSNLICSIYLEVSSDLFVPTVDSVCVFCLGSGPYSLAALWTCGSCSSVTSTLELQRGPCQMCSIRRGSGFYFLLLGWLHAYFTTTRNTLFICPVKWNGEFCRRARSYARLPSSTLLDRLTDPHYLYACHRRRLAVSAASYHN